MSSTKHAVRVRFSLQRRRKRSNAVACTILYASAALRRVSGRCEPGGRGAGAGVDLSSEAVGQVPTREARQSSGKDMSVGRLALFRAVAGSLHGGPGA